jgi:pentatricopeptide repeat protein
MRQFNISAGIVIYTNLMHICFKNGENDSAEVAYSLMVENGIKGKIFRKLKIFS